MLLGKSMGDKWGDKFKRSRPRMVLSQFLYQKPAPKPYCTYFITEGDAIG